jgi:DNA-binding GntR family transcriptional regulator
MDRKTLTTLVGSWSLGTGPLYYRLAQALEKAILQGDLPSGTRLPAERLLAQDLV